MGVDSDLEIGTHVDPDGTRMVDPEGRNLAQKMASSEEIR